MDICNKKVSGLKDSKQNMALICCPECQKEISCKTQSCPYCGCPINVYNKWNLEYYKSLDFARGVKWNLNPIGHSCDECLGLAGREYDLNNVPDKPHRGCRCFLTLVIDKNYMYQKYGITDGIIIEKTAKKWKGWKLLGCLSLILVIIIIMKTIDNKKEIQIAIEPSKIIMKSTETIIKPTNMVRVQGTPVETSKTIKKSIKIMIVNDDFSMVLEDNKIIIFNNALWEDDRKEEIVEFLNEYKDKKVRIYFVTERTSSIGDYKLKQDGRGYYLIKDIRDNSNKSVLDELKKRNLIKGSGE